MLYLLLLMVMCARAQDSEYEALAVTAAITLREYGHLKRLIGGSTHDESSQDAKSPAKDRLAKKGAAFCC